MMNGRIGSKLDADVLTPAEIELLTKQCSRRAPTGVPTVLSSPSSGAAGSYRRGAGPGSSISSLMPAEADACNRLSGERQPDCLELVVLDTDRIVDLN
jgi:hypothetical protein